MIFPVLVNSKAPIKDQVAEIENQYVCRLLAECHGNILEASRVSGLSRPTLYRIGTRAGVLTQYTSGKVHRFEYPDADYRDDLSDRVGDENP